MTVRHVVFALVLGPMPKGSQDFVKQKQKVGKRKLAPTNATSTRFKAKSVALTEQSVSVEKKGPTTVRNLTAGELLAQLNHYSDPVRTDALNGLCELIGTHNDVLLPHATLLIERVTMLTEDSSRKVRLAAHGLLRATVPLLKETGALAVHERTLTLRLQALISHHDSTVRFDALPLLQLILQQRPSSLVPPPKQLISCLADLLSCAELPSARSRLGAIPEARLATISSIRALLRAQTGRPVSGSVAEAGSSSAQSQWPQQAQARNDGCTQ